MREIKRTPAKVLADKYGSIPSSDTLLTSAAKALKIESTEVFKQVATFYDEYVPIHTSITDLIRIWYIIKMGLVKAKEGEELLTWLYDGALEQRIKFTNPLFLADLENKKLSPRREYGYTLEQSEDRGGQFWNLIVTDTTAGEDIEQYTYYSREEAQTDIEHAYTKYAVNLEQI